MWNHKCDFYLETVTGEIFGKKEEILLWRKILIDWLEMLYDRL